MNKNDESTVTRGVHPSSFIPHPFKELERETRFELATLALARRCSTTELLPLWSSSDSNDSMFVVKRGSFGSFGVGCGWQFRVQPLGC